MSAAVTEHRSSHGYAGYWLAWIVLLVITVLMTRVQSRALLLTGIGVKSSIICAWFMHLKAEGRSLVGSVVIGFGFALFLFFLISFDAHR